MPAASVALQFVCFALRGSLAAAWAYQGHERINQFAQDLLKGKHRDQIRTMMHSDVVEVAGWEKTMTQKYPETDRLHWHRQQPEWTCGSRGGLGDKGHVRCDGHGAEKGSLFCALAYFFDHFAHDTLLTQFPAPEEPIDSPSSLAALAKVPSSELTPSNYLRWLSILVGDLHQPLHWLSEHDHGREVLVIYGNEEYSLLYFWEEYIPSRLVSGQTKHITKQLEQEWAKKNSVWELKAPGQLFRDWAKEVAETLCTEVYAPMTVNHADGTRVESRFQLTEEMFQKWLTVGERLLTTGGMRLACVLNDILEHKRHKEAHKQGRGLFEQRLAVGATAKLEKDTDLIQQLVTQQLRRDARGNFMWNMFIAAILVPSLLFAYTWHERSGGGSFWRIAKVHLKM